MIAIKVVLFDVGNVVVRASHAITWAILQDMGVSSRRARHFYQHSLYKSFSRGFFTEEFFAGSMRGILKAYNLSDEQIRLAHDAHIYSADQSVIDVIRQLRSRGIRLAFATTTNPWQDKRVEQLVDLNNYAPDEQIFLSHRRLKRKTDRGEAKAILQELDVHASDVLVVDDSAECIQVFQRAGARIHHYDPTPVSGVVALRRSLRSHGLL